MATLDCIFAIWIAFSLRYTVNGVRGGWKNEPGIFLFCKAFAPVYESHVEKRGWSFLSIRYGGAFSWDEKCRWLFLGQQVSTCRLTGWKMSMPIFRLRQCANLGVVCLLWFLWLLRLICSQAEKRGWFEKIYWKNIWLAFKNMWGKSKASLVLY